MGDDDDDDDEQNQVYLFIYLFLFYLLSIQQVSMSEYRRELLGVGGGMRSVVILEEHNVCAFCCCRSLSLRWALRATTLLNLE